VHVTFRPVTAEDAESGSGSVIGEGIPDLAVHLLDRGLEPVPAGVPGEMFVGGAGVARGYLGRPELTAERFVPDPFAAEPGARMYRSGDRARRRAGGGLEYLGRADQQVKVRGFRIEPGEVEAALLGHPGVREALVMAREDEPGARLVAYVVADAAAGEPAVEALRAHLAERLPEHMVPAVFVVLDAFPLTPHGKTDRRALPAPETNSAEDTYVAPRTATEERLAATWADVLRAGRVGVHDSFFDLGGHSMLATQVVSRVRHAFGVELRVADLFNDPTVEALARRVDDLLAAGAPADPAGPIAKQARRGVARRTSPQ
ncbi:MAG: phosphopantetheine-binding protein, partial [Longimicrobiaceae bacterium]